jgi:outer membrane lipoprotein SlyB
MRALTAREVSQVAGGRDTWVFTGHPISVANIEAIKNSFEGAVVGGALGGAVAGSLHGPMGAMVGTIAGTLAGATSWAYTVSIDVPTITYTPVITIIEVPPDGGGSGSGCD